MADYGQAFATSPNVYERLVESFAPSIWEMDDVKKGILCQLFGGTSAGQGGSDRPSSGQPRERGSHEHKQPHQRSDINILLCGDPGTSKSQILSYVHKVHPGLGRLSEQTHFFLLDYTAGDLY